MTILGAIFVVFPVLLFFGIRRLARPLIRSTPVTSQFGFAITRVGYVFYGCQVLYMLVCVVAYNIDPAGWLGAVLHTTEGLVCATVLAVVGFNVVAIRLMRIGYPPLRRHPRDV